MRMRELLLPNKLVGYATALARDIVAKLPLGHLHCIALRPSLGPITLHALRRAPGVMAIEYNGQKGGFAGSEPVGNAENFRCAFNKAPGALTKVER